MNCRRILFFAGIVAVLGVGGWFRLAGLGDRPVHFDEATGARILGERLETGRYVFDREHFHGPLLSSVTSPVVQVRGESSWDDLTKGNLRLGVALLSVLTVAGTLLVGRFGGRGDGLAAAALVATSPLLAYYGRMFIHEPVFIAFGLFTLLAVLSFLRRPGPLAAAALGVGAGLMAATRETVVISLFAWAAAGVAWPWPNRSVAAIWRSHGRYLWIPLILGLATIVVFYSDFGRHPKGPADFIRTYFDYAVVPGHEKPFFFYLEMLLWPRLRGGLWWTEGGVLLLAVYGYVRCEAGPVRSTCRFLLHAGAAHLVVFSLLAYKTPWLACLGWLHVCLAAGFGGAQLVREWRIPAAVAMALLLFWQGVQCNRAVFRFAADTRNPYAYVPTSKDAERMATWLDQLAGDHPQLNEAPVVVVGKAYWPLPWYLRGFDRVGYWSELPADAATRPLILLVSSGEGPDTSALQASHTFFPRGLREEVLVTVALRNDIWENTNANP